MASLSWGKPTVEWGISTNGAPATTWTKFSEIQEDSTKLTPTAGTKKKATQEGGAAIAVRYGANEYSAELKLFVKKGDTKPFADVDGVVPGEYSLRLTPEDETCPGWTMDCTKVHCEEDYSAADGTFWKYVFDGLKPATGNIVKEYIKPTGTGTGA